jgi:large subunit ribosomal protein L19
MTNLILEAVEQPHLKSDPPKFDVGDTVDVHTRIIEGDKERIQVFSGTVLMRKGRGINETFTVRRIVNNEGVERIFPLHSPFVAKVVVRRGGRTRRAKLYYLRERVGKAVRLGEKRKEKRDEAQPATAERPTPASAELAAAGT